MKVFLKKVKKQHSFCFQYALLEKETLIYGVKLRKINAL